MKKQLRILITVATVLILAHFMPRLSLAAGGYTGTGTFTDPFVVTTAEGLRTVLGKNISGTKYIRLDKDINSNQSDYIICQHIKQNTELDLRGHLLKSKLAFNYESDERGNPMFIIDAGASFTVKDSSGGGEIIHDRLIPACPSSSGNYKLLTGCVTVFRVNGTLNILSGEYTAGHYESEHYSVVYNLSSGGKSQVADVNSVSAGNVVDVRAKGTLNVFGGELYGRGFYATGATKAAKRAAVLMEVDAKANIYGGEFYGKTNADVFFIDAAADLKVYGGKFYAKYDNKVTVWKARDQGIPYVAYTNVDCGSIGIPLSAFKHDSLSNTQITVNGKNYTYKSNYSTGEDEAFIATGKEGTGATIEVSQKSRTFTDATVTVNGKSSGTYYQGGADYVTCNANLLYANVVGQSPCQMLYTWTVYEKTGNGYQPATLNVNYDLITSSPDIELSNLGNFVKGGWKNGTTYKISCWVKEYISYQAANATVHQNASGYTFTYSTQKEPQKITEVKVVGTISPKENLWETMPIAASGTGVKTSSVVYKRDGKEMENGEPASTTGMYQATVYVYAKDDYIFTQNTKYYYNGTQVKDVVVNSNKEVKIRLPEVKIEVPTTQVAKINYVSVFGINMPEVGKKISAGNAQTTDSRYQILSTYYDVHDADTFNCETEYTVFVSIMTNGDYEFVTEKELTAIVNGGMGKVISVSSYNRMAYISYTFQGIPHVEKEKITAATCTTAGFSEVYCEACGQVLANGVIPATGHDFQNGVCQTCGEKDPNAPTEKETERETEVETKETEEEVTGTYDLSDLESSKEEESSETGSTEIASAENPEKPTKKLDNKTFFWMVATPAVLAVGIVGVLVALIIAIKKGKKKE